MRKVYLLGLLVGMGLFLTAGSCSDAEKDCMAAGKVWVSDTCITKQENCVTNLRWTWVAGACVNPNAPVTVNCSSITAKLNCQQEETCSWGANAAGLEVCSDAACDNYEKYAECMAGKDCKWTGAAGDCSGTASICTALSADAATCGAATGCTFAAASCVANAGTTGDCTAGTDATTCNAITTCTWRATCKGTAAACSTYAGGAVCDAAGGCSTGYADGKFCEDA